jgi:hypothetical protein
MRGLTSVLINACLFESLEPHSVSLQQHQAAASSSSIKHQASSISISIKKQHHAAASMPACFSPPRYFVGSKIFSHRTLMPAMGQKFHGIRFQSGSLMWGATVGIFCPCTRYFVGRQLTCCYEAESLFLPKMHAHVHTCTHTHTHTHTYIHTRARVCKRWVTSSQ